MSVKLFWCRCLASTLIALGLLSGFTAAADDGLRMDTLSTRLAFNPAGQLVSFSLAGFQNQLGSNIESSVWRAELKRGTNTITISGANARSYSARLEGMLSNEARLCWSGFSDFPNLEVRVSINVPGDFSASHWRIQFRGLGEGVLSQVHFPVIGDVVEQFGETLAAPVWMGQQTSEPRKILANQRQAWAYPGILSMQCAALCVSNSTGIYTACNDTQSFGKILAFTGGAGNRLSFQWTHLPERTARPVQSWALPYDVIVAPHLGDWFSAAERYRSWATNQHWASQSRLARKEVPAWVTRTGLWVWNRGRSPGVLDPAIVLKETSGLPVSVFWHWWHGCSYDADFPEYLPPREGTEPFKTAVAKAQARDVRALVYMNQRLWGMETASWTNRGAAKFAVKKPDGTIHPEIYNTFTQTPCAAMCMGTRFWRDTYADLAQRAILDLGVNGIYMDQACTSLSCYDPAHGHPIGGGKYWMEGFQKLAKDIRARTAHRPTRLKSPADQDYSAKSSIETALAGEGTGESWLPHLDIMLSLQVSKERYAGADLWETIPFFHAVYHPFFVPFGNYSSLTMPPYDDLWPTATAPTEPLKLLDRKFSGQFRLEQARAFVWGQQPTIANFLPEHLQSRREEVDYVLRLAKVRAQALPYLLHGTMLPSPTFDSHAAKMDFSRLSIYAGQQGGLKEFQKSADQVLAATWRSPEGRVAIALASISSEPIHLPISLDEVPGFGKRLLHLTKIDEAGRKALPAQNANELRISLQSYDAFLLELR